MGSELPFQWQLTRSRRKTVALQVKHGEVHVRAPLKFSGRLIEEFVVSRADWVMHQLVEQARKAQEIHAICHGATLPFMDGSLMLEVTPHNRNRVTHGDNTLLIQTRHTDQAKIQKQVEQWFKQQCQEGQASVRWSWEEEKETKEDI